MVRTPSKESLCVSMYNPLLSTVAKMGPLTVINRLRKGYKNGNNLYSLLNSLSQVTLHFKELIQNLLTFLLILLIRTYKMFVIN